MFQALRLFLQKGQRTYEKVDISLRLITLLVIRTDRDETLVQAEPTQPETYN